MTGSTVATSGPGAAAAPGDEAGRIGREERAARAAWTRIAEPSDPRAQALVEHLGPVEALARALDGDPLVPEAFRLRAARSDFERDLEIAAGLGARIVCPGDVDWPVRLDDLPVPPLALWARGPLRLELLAERSVALVGARASTRYGEGVATDLASGLAERGFAVVSGAAFGIDAAAHRGALAVDGPSVAVLAGGIDRPYPVAHTRLIGTLVETGAVVSEVAPGSAPTRPRFLLRNRLIAAMTSGTVVVEAGLRSGSLNTLTTACELGRPVGVVPGPVTSMVSAGCHQANRDGKAVLVTDVDEVVDLVGSYGTDAAPRRRAPTQPEDALDPLDAQVLSAVPVRRSSDADSIALAAGLAPSAVTASLPRLELLGLVRRDSGEWRKT